MQPLAGKVVGGEPGHNGDNVTAAAVIDAPVFSGRTTEARTACLVGS